ncbi:hypothetical protein DBB29_06935 [Pandoraea cepalis]|uniref:Uncharacterized protein n=1 Tax=Pandoraea cepalis TaxID=2508294 RepID=A0AAW7MJV5_9BURK|nr:hypothetical protein [Pandoraea cepalis]MDN4577849.1 hypothetical protein [Pandoraea cepalis]
MVVGVRCEWPGTRHKACGSLDRRVAGEKFALAAPGMTTVCQKSTYYEAAFARRFVSKWRSTA